MKRSPLTRKTPLKAKAGIQRKPMKQTSYKKTAAKKAARSDVRWRSAEYLAWIRTLSCACCGGPGGDAHHLIGMWGLSGAGLTAPDNYAMPLCRACHQEVHRNPDLQQAQPEWLRITVEKALAAMQQGGAGQYLPVQGAGAILKRLGMVSLKVRNAPVSSSALYPLTKSQHLLYLQLFEAFLHCPLLPQKCLT